MQEQFQLPVQVQSTLQLRKPKKTAKEGLRAERLPGLKTSVAASGRDNRIDILGSVKNYLLHDRFELKYQAENPKATANIIFLLDTSGSMAANQQMGLVKGIIAQTLQKKQHKKVCYAMIMLDGEFAKIVQSFTGNHKQIRELNYQIRTRGKTNLGDGFLKVHELIRGIDKDMVQLFTFTDGKANRSGDSSSPFEYAVNCYRKFVGRRVQASIIDTEQGFVRIGKAKELAEKLKIKYQKIYGE